MIARSIGDERGSVRLDPFLYGSTDPHKNRALSRVRTVSPNEGYDAGYRDRLNVVNVHYNAGFGAGHNAMRLITP